MNYYCIKINPELINTFISYINDIEGKITGCTFNKGKYMFVYKANNKVTIEDLKEFKGNDNECI